MKMQYLAVCMILLPLLGGCVLSVPAETPETGITIPTKVIEPQQTMGSAPTTHPQSVFKHVELVNIGESSQEELLEMAAMSGCWHVLPGVPAEYAERFIFNTNLTFSYYCNNLDGEKRELASYGTWTIEGKDLILNIMVKKVLEGGELIPANGSVATEFDIEGGKVKYLYLENPEVIKLTVGPIEHEEGVQNYDISAQNAFKRRLGDTYYWKFDSFYDQISRAEVMNILGMEE